MKKDSIAMKSGFTLVEMLVVIGILGILMGVLVGSLSGSTEGARNAQCLTNMKNLASACHSYGMTSGYYPLAGSVEKVSVEKQGSGSSSSFSPIYYEVPGWLGWNSAGAYAKEPTSTIANKSWYISSYNKDDIAREYAYTNGVLFKYLSGNKNCYRCPMHVKKFAKQNPAWSYVMNADFGWQYGSRKTSYFYGKLSRADKKLLFAEIGFMGVEDSVNTGEGSDSKCDCILQYKDNELIGFNHASGKKAKFAHVVFADGHVEKISWPKAGLSQSDVQDLTTWLCEGTDVTFDGTRYQDASNL